ncbi:hypothetical protein BKA65DRAFT_564974 [Rhexocercosporidium sp. MPI-PUGE-AT-0058]|nr:hypothetical protein BKA65DRAFT_564974 [Rhexocercosporidium sp. MPI-PUGE-AT-0058]
MSQFRGSGPSVNVSKMDKRFSTLFLESPRISADKSAETKLPPSKMKKLLGRLFKSARRSPKPSPEAIQPQMLTPEQRAEHLWDVVIGLVKPIPNQPSTISKTVKPHPAPKPTGGTAKSTQAITVPPPSSVPSYTTKDIFYKGKGKPVSSSRDSKFSSISSLPSLKTLNISPTITPSTTAPSSTTTTTPNAHITLTPPEFRHLQSLLRRTTRRLKHQEYLVSNLANNLLYIFYRKETQMQNLKRLRKAEQQNMLSTIFRTKEHCGRLFLRKSAFLSHSFACVTKLQKILDEAAQEATMSIPEACTSRQASEGVRYVVCREAVGDFVGEMGRDVGVQRGLDGELRNYVLEKAGEGRWVTSVSEGIMMVRFVGFLDGRGEVLEGCYGGLEEIVKKIEEVVRESDDTLLL